MQWFTWLEHAIENLFADRNHEQPTEGRRSSTRTKPKSSEQPETKSTAPGWTAYGLEFSESAAAGCCDRGRTIGVWRVFGGCLDE